MTWSWETGHDVRFYGGDMTLGHDSTILNEGPAGLKAPFSKLFSGGTVLFRCDRDDHSTIDDAGVCHGMCGGYTDRPPPAAPAITWPPAGSSHYWGVTIQGTADPWTYVSVADTQGSLGTLVLADRLGHWTLRAQPADLTPGEHTLAVTARDILGRTSPATTFAIDLLPQPPLVPDHVAPSAVIPTDAGSASAGDSIVLRGTATDNVGVRGVSLEVYDSQSRRVRTYLAFCPECGPRQTSVTFEREIPTGLWLEDLAPGIYSVKIKSRDDAGNIGTSSRIQFLVASPAGADSLNR